MTRLIAALVRHGEYHQLPDTPSALQPFALTAAGDRQAAQGAAELQSQIDRQGWVPAAVIDSSSLLRAWQTAQHFLSVLPAAGRIEEFDALRERSVGIAGNLSVEQIEQVLAQDPRYTAPAAGWKSDSHYRLPLSGAESLLQAGERVAGHLRRAMNALPRRGPDRIKLFVGHGAAFRHAAYHLGVLGFEQLARLSMFHAHPVCLELLPDGSWLRVAGDWKQRYPKDAFTD